MNINNFLLFFLGLLFFIIFFYVLFTNKNVLTKFIVTKDYENNLYDLKINNKYSFKKCTDMCTKDFCDKYHSKKINYDLCKECKKDNKCYDSSSGKCISCKNNYSCEKLYGSNNKPPIDPLNNFCSE